MSQREHAAALGSIVDVLRQLPVDVLNRSFWPLLSGEDLCSFRAAGHAARNLFLQTKATVRIEETRARLYDAGTCDSQARFLQKHSACTSIEVSVQAPSNVTTVAVRVVAGAPLSPSWLSWFPQLNVLMSSQDITATAVAHCQLGTSWCTICMMILDTWHYIYQRRHIYTTLWNLYMYHALYL